MLWSTDHPTSKAAEKLLRQAGFRPCSLVLSAATSSITLLQSPHALVALAGADSWASAAGDLQTLSDALTEWARANAKDPIRWDLYLLALIGSALSGEEAKQARSFEADITHIRKLVRPLPTLSSRGSQRALQDALRAFLPLSAIPALIAENPLGALETELHRKNLSPELIDKALTSFRQYGEVVLL